MKIEEYKHKLDLINTQAEIARTHLAQEFAFSNNTVSIGDVVEDHIGKIKVDEIKFWFRSGELPCCVYIGVKLNKDGNPNKRNEKLKVYQHNLKTK